MVRRVYPGVLVLGALLTSGCSSTLQATKPDENGRSPSGNTSLAADDVRGSLATLSSGDGQDVTIAKFAKAAAVAKDETTLLPFIWPTTLNSFGVGGWKDFLKSALPFFAGAPDVDTYQGLAPMDFDGTPAIVHFGYVKGADGKRRPFSMALVTTAEGTFIANLRVAECVKGHHPICD